jgi:hypothetical protein
MREVDVRKILGVEESDKPAPEYTSEFFCEELADLNLVGMELHSDFRECESMCEMLSTCLVLVYFSSGRSYAVVAYFGLWHLDFEH